MNPAVADQIRSTVEARLRELQPVVTELEQLRNVLALLDAPEGHQLPPGAPALLRSGGAFSAFASVTPIRREHHGSKPGRDGRAPQGANKQRILAAIAEHPGIAAPRVAQLTGLKRPLVASTISRLKRTGELQAHGDGVRLSTPSDCAEASRPRSTSNGEQSHADREAIAQA